MTDQELLEAAKLVLIDAVAEAEFSGLPKDVSYVNFVGNKVEGLRAKIENCAPIKLKYELVGNRMFVKENQ